MKIKYGHFSYIFMFLILMTGISSLTFSFYWINKLFKQEEQKQYGSIVRKVEESLMSIREEVDIMNIMLFISGKEFEDKDFTNFSTKLEFWMDNTKYPTLLEEVYILLPPENEHEKKPEFYNWDFDSKSFTYHPIPTILRQYGQAVVAEDSIKIKAMEKTLTETGLIFNEMQIHTTLLRNDKKGGPFLFAKTNIKELYAKIAPDYFNKDLSEYDWVIIKPGEIINKEADFWLTLDEMLFLKHSFWTPDNKTADKLLNSRSYESFKMWMNRNGIDQWKKQISLRTSPHQNRNSYYLQISHKDDSIHSQLSRQKHIYLFLSFFFTFILLYSIFALYRMNRRTENIQKKQRDFMYSLGHELKTPLAVILSSSELLLRTNDKEKLQRYGSNIRKQSLRLTSQIERFLLHARMENRLENPIHKEPVDLRKFMKEILFSLEVLAKIKNAEIQMDTKSLDEVITTDREMLMMIMENLITNALKYGIISSPKKISPIRIRAVSEESSLCLYVEDDGKGISIMEKNLIFHKFFRGRRNLTSEKRGSGLGLNLSRKAAKLLSGDLTMESPYQKTDGTVSTGTRIILNLGRKE